MTKLLIPILLILTSTGCSTRLFTVHKVDVRQGSALTEEDTDKITPGMPKAQVKQLLGLPVLVPAFSPNRWDYVYYLDSQEHPEKKRGLSVYFEGNQVSSVEKF
ncbi:MAG: outer membrane protein assembly factor BamE [bacterium]